MKSDQKGEIEVKVQPIKLDEVPGEYVNYMYVAHTGDDFHLYFSEIAPLPTLKIPRSGNTVTVKTQPKIKLTVPPTVIPRIIEALQKNYEKYKESLRKREQQND